jgi:pimeloyl-ACP methyl ester carboxylesterase
MAAISHPNHRASLAAVQAPALVVHGLADRLIAPSGGRATAAAIPGAELMLIPGMGHDLPPELWERLGDAIETNASRAGGRARSGPQRPAPRQG